MRSVLFQTTFWGLLGIFTLGGVDILWAHEGENHSTTTLSLQKAAYPIRYEDITTVNLENEPVKLSDYQGKVIFLNFWATWCVPCRVEMPSMKRLEKKLKDKPFVIVTVNLQESSEKIKKFYQNLKLTFDTLLDPDGKIFKLYNASQLPTTYIIDKQGFMVAKAEGPREWDSEESIGYIIHLAT